MDGKEIVMGFDGFRFQVQNFLGRDFHRNFAASRFRVRN